MRNTKKKAPVKKTSATKPTTKRMTTKKCVNTQKKPVTKKNTFSQKDDVKAKEFRYNKARGGHPAYIVKVVKKPQPKKAKFVGLTEHDTTFGVKNVLLDENPNPKLKGQKAYARPKVDEVILTKKTFGKKLEGWEFAISDKEKIRIIIENDSNKKKK